MRDVNGLPVRKGMNGVFDHLKEVKDVQTSTEALLWSLKGIAPAQRRLLENALHDCKKLLKRIMLP